MRSFAIINIVFVLCIGFVYGTPLAAVASQATESAQTYNCEASESYSANSASGSAYQASSSSASSSTSSSSSSSSSSTSFDYNYYSGYFNNVACIDAAQREAYLAWLSNYSPDQLMYVNGILDYLTVDQCLSSDILDYNLVQKDILTAYNLLNTNNIYSTNIDLMAQSAILDQAMPNIVNALNGLSPSSPLYSYLQYCTNNDITMLPLAVGLCNGIVQNQATYFTSSSSSSSSVRSVESSSSTVSSSSVSNVAAGSSAIDTALFESAFRQATINDAEAQLYLKYLSGIPCDQIAAFNEIISYYNSPSQVITSEMITDFNAFQTQINAAYDLLAAQSIYAANADWMTQTAILEQAKLNLANALSYASPNCCLYNALNFAMNSDLTYLPLVTGSYYYLLQQQASYFSSSASSSSYLASSSSSSSMSESASGGSAIVVAR